MKPNIVILDGATLNNGDLSWQPIKNLGNVTVYDRTPPEKVTERALHADILLINKIVLNATTLAALPRLRCIALTSTGYNTIDIQAATHQKIIVCNGVGYGTDSVAQHIFALMLEITNQVGQHNQSVRRGKWAKHPDFCYALHPMMELSGKILGIYGFGRIGQQTAAIGAAFGMKILVTSRGKVDNFEQVSLEELCKRSDFIVPTTALTPENQGIINQKLLNIMKPTTYFINTSRGALVHEPDLLVALEQRKIAGAALDVLSIEPPRQNILLQAKLKNLIITPHNAWMTREARARLLQIVADNVQNFLEGTPKNVVNPL
jgi:glycerate dehydrogenase